MYGFESSKKIRQIEDIRKSGIPIIALTTSIEAALEDISNNEYIDDWMLKPFKVEHLKEKLEKIANHLPYSILF